MCCGFHRTGLSCLAAIFVFPCRTSTKNRGSNRHLGGRSRAPVLSDIESFNPGKTAGCSISYLICIVKYGNMCCGLAVLPYLGLRVNKEAKNRPLGRFFAEEHSLFCSVLVSAFPDSLMRFRYRINRYGLDRDPQHRLDKMYASEEEHISASN